MMRVSRDVPVRSSTADSTTTHGRNTLMFVRSHNPIHGVGRLACRRGTMLSERSRLGRPTVAIGRILFRERARQPEPWEQAVVEARHGTDPIAGEGQDEKAGPAADTSVGRAKIDPERRLTIRTR